MNNDIEKAFRKAMKEAERWARDDLPRQVGKTAVDLFRENFTKEGFTDGGVKKWKEVKRRIPQSGWYGFEYKGEKRTAYAFSRDHKTGRTRKAKKQRKLNFSRAATTRKILNGRTHELQDSLRYEPAGGGVAITSDKPYAAVQNDGGNIRVFGKRTVRLAARPFVGPSKELDNQIKGLVDDGLRKIFGKS